MKNSIPSIKKAIQRGFTLLELLVVIVIIAILAGMVMAGFPRAMEMAESAKSVNSLKQITTSTILLMNEMGGRLPSPEYPGGMVVPNGMTGDDIFPDYWDALPESGLWLDGVVFGEIYMKVRDQRIEDSGGTVSGASGYAINEEGEHLRGTHFFSMQSFKQDPSETDLHKHSYAMNKNLQYDRINDTNGSQDPWLTEKTISNLLFSVNAMLYIECKESNVVEYEDRQLILDTMLERWTSKKAITSFLDGHVDRLIKNDIPDDDPQQDGNRKSSRFWRGVDP